MLTENDVVDAVCDHLQQAGYRIERRCSTKQRGTDVIAVETQTNRKVLVEAKGATSSKPGSARFGKPFNNSQVRDHVAKAWFAAAKLVSNNREPGTVVAIALPDNEAHRREVDGAKQVIDSVGVKVWFVSDDRKLSSP